LAAPNLLNISSIVAHTSITSLGSSVSNALTNNAGSNTVLKMEDLILTNTTNGILIANVFVARTVQSPGGTFAIASNISVPAYSVLAVLGKDTPLYLEEGDTLQGQATGTINMFVAYDIVST
jgi:hypothetical protein